MYDESQTKMLWDHPTSLVYDKKLDTALRKTSVRMMKDKIEMERESHLPFDVKLLLSNIQKDLVLDADTDNSCYGHILKKILTDSKSRIAYGTRKRDKLQTAFECAKQNLLFQHKYSNKQNNTHMKDKSTGELEDKLKVMKPNITIMNLMYIADKFKFIVDKVGFIKRKLPANMSDEEKLDSLRKDAHTEIEGLGLYICWSIHHAYISLGDGRNYVVPISYVLMIHNKLCDLISVYLLCMYQEGICHQDTATNILIGFVDELCNLSIKYKDSFAEISGSIEGLVIGEILEETEEWDNRDLTDNISRDLMKSINFNYDTSRLRMWLQMADIPLRNELGCCSKLLGHPFVDMRKGAEKLYKRTTEPKLLTYEAVSWVTNKAKETFVKNYLTRHGKWPLVTITSTLPGRDPLMRAMLANKDPDHPSIKGKYGSVDERDWARVELEKVMEFEQLENIIPFLKDKSVSVLRNEAIRLFINKERGAKTKWEDTRLLLYYMLNPLKKIDHISFLQEYASTETLDLLADYLIIRLVPKEKEHKIAFRGFGVKTYMDRMRSLAQEKNMAHFLSLYCDEQAMTMGEIDISKRLYALRTILKAYHGYRVLNINFDSSGWNNCFRDETVKPVLRETVSKIFGNDVMHRIHEAYEKTLFMIPDGDVTYHWNGQQGGIDGLNQYAWVWVYINQIKYAMKDLPVKYHMFCKGDDMRLAVLIRPELLENHDMKYWHQLIVNAVSQTATQFGHEIKVTESYGSEKFFTFSKSASIGTIELPQGFRKIQKVYGANNAMIATLDEYIASSFSNAHSACRCMTNTYSAYFVALVWGYYYLTLSNHFDKLSNDELMCLLLIPNMLGGFPIIYLHNMRVRAESDLLSPFMDMLLYARKSHPNYYRIMRRFLYVEIPSKRSFTKLYRDPYSLWIKTPVLPTSILRSFITPMLKRVTKNEDIQELIKATTSSFSKEIIKSMESAVPQDAKILATVYSATPDGILGELLRKFESGRSILELLLLKRNYKNADWKFQRILRAEEKLQKWRCEKIMENTIFKGTCYTKIEDNSCPARLAQDLRDRTWGTRITGISMPPLAHQVTISRPIDVSHNEWALQNHFVYNYDPPTTFINQHSSHHWGVAGKSPFLGYTTRTGNIAPIVSFQEKDPLLIKVRNLLDILSWVNKTITYPDGTTVSSNLSELIELILSMYTDITTEQLAPFTAKRKSGTIQHHSRAPRFRESIVPNLLSNAYQNISGSSDTHNTLRESDMHYTVNFLHIMCECSHLIQIEMETGPNVTSPRLLWGITTACPECTIPIEEEPIVLSYLPPGFNVPSILNTCRLDQISKQMILSSFQDFDSGRLKATDTHSNPGMEMAMIGVCMEFMAHYHKTHIKLQNRFTQHAMTGEAHSTLVNLTHATTSRTIGFTEIKRIRNPVIIESMVPIITDFIMNKLHDYDDERLLLQLQRIHSSELPWVGMLEILCKAGKLGSMIHSLEQSTRIQAPACYEDPKSSAAYVGYTIFKLIREAKLPFNICIRSWMNEDNARIELNSFTDPFKWKMLDKFFCSLTRLWKPNTDDDRLKHDITRQGVYVCASYIDSEALTQVLFNQLEPNELHDIAVTEFMNLDYNSLMELYEDEESTGGKMLSWLTRHYPSWSWDTMREEVMEGTFNDEIADKILRGLPSLHINLGISDIASCILVLRSGAITDEDLGMFRTDGTDSESDDYAMFPAHYILQGRMRIENSDFIFRSRTPCSDNNTLSNITAREYDFSYDKIILDQCHTLRLYGSTTTSQNKLDHCLSITQLPRVLPDGITIMCLADGYGGFVEYLSTCTRNSKFIFNTLATRQGKNCFPYSALWALEAHNNKVDTELVDSGLDDLSTDECCKALREKYNSVSIVTCDADVKWSDRSIARKIMENVVKIYLDAGTHDSVLILKCNLGHATHIVDCMSVLKRYNHKVYLVRCPQSNTGGEVYIVAYGLDRFPLDVDEIQFKATDLEYGEMDHFSYRYYQSFRQTLLGHHRLELFPRITRSRRFKIDELHCAATTKMMTRLGIDCNLYNLCCDMSHKEDVIDYVMGKLSDALNTSINALRVHTSTAYRGAAYNQDTHAHALFLAMRCFSLHGCIYIVRESRDHDTVSKNNVRYNYCIQYDRLQRLVVLPPITASHYNKNFSIREQTPYFAPYMRYIDGLRVGQMIIGYVGYSKIPRRTYTDASSLFQ